MLSPKEGMWHQPRRRRLQPKRLQRRSVLLRRRPRRSVLLRRRPLRSVLLRRRPLRSVLLRRRPLRSVLLRRRPPRSVLPPRRLRRSVLQPRGLSQRSSRFSQENLFSRGPQGPLECCLGVVEISRLVDVEAPLARCDDTVGDVEAFSLVDVATQRLRSVREVKV